MVQNCARDSARGMRRAPVPVGVGGCAPPCQHRRGHARRSLPTTLSPTRQGWNLVRRWGGAPLRQPIMSRIHHSTPSAAAPSPRRRVDAYMWRGGTTDAGRCVPHTLESASGRIVSVGSLSVKTSFESHTRRVPHELLELAHITVCPHAARQPRTPYAVCTGRCPSSRSVGPRVGRGPRDRPCPQVRHWRRHKTPRTARKVACSHA